MKAISISGHETSFNTSGLDALGKKFILKPKEFQIVGSNDFITIIECVRNNNDKSFYYQEQTLKRKIIIHFTMGYLKGDIATLTKDFVSVPFVIGRNGNIYNLFPSKYWSYHLGPGAIGGNTAMSKECIGIELSNIGPLKRIGEHLVTSYSDTDVYCSLLETQYFTKLSAKYRGYDYYAKFTDNQYQSLIKLINFLCQKYNLPKNFLPVDNRFNVMNEMAFRNYTGIATHVNCRTDKVDIGPAFDWDKVIHGVTTF